MNKTFLVGHLTKDPELKYTNDTTAVCTFTIAVNRQFSNAQGEKEADYINIVVWRKQAENVKKYCLKGSLVGIDGKIQTRTYKDKDNKTVYVTEVVADNVTFLGAKSQSNGQALAPKEEPSTIPDEPFADFGETVELNEDDIAF